MLCDSFSRRPSRLSLQSSTRCCFFPCPAGPSPPLLRPFSVRSQHICRLFCPAPETTRIPRRPARPQDEGCEKSVVSSVFATDEEGKAALLRSVPESVGSIITDTDDETRSSIAFLCSMARRTAFEQG